MNSLEPYAKVNIQDQIFICLFDLGCDATLILHEEKLSHLNKKKVGQTTLVDISGNEYPTDIFEIPKLMVANFGFHNIEILNDSNEFYFNTQFGISSQEVRNENAIKRISRFDGKIGRNLFSHADCYLDFPNLMISLFEKGTGKKHCKSKNFTSAPFILADIGIVIEVNIDSQSYRMLLDTGANYSFVKQSLANQFSLKVGDNDVYCSCSRLLFADCNYGSWDFGIIEIPEKWKIDACLGTDFFLEYAVYLDFENQTAYIQRPEKFCISTQWKRIKNRIIKFKRTNEVTQDV